MAVDNRVTVKCVAEIADVYCQTDEVRLAVDVPQRASIMEDRSDAGENVGLCVVFIGLFMWFLLPFHMWFSLATMWFLLAYYVVLISKKNKLYLLGIHPQKGGIISSSYTAMDYVLVGSLFLELYNIKQ